VNVNSAGAVAPSAVTGGGSAAVTITPATPLPAAASVSVIAGVTTLVTNPTVVGSDSLAIMTSADTTPATAGYAIAAAAAAKVVATAGSGQSHAVGGAFATPLSATVEDQYGNPVLTPSAQVVFTAPASGASGTFLNGTATTTVASNGSGVATATTYTANTTPGTYAVTAAATGLTSARCTETNVVGPASQIVAAAGGNQGVTVGALFTTPLSATVEDQYGNPVAGNSVTFTAPATGASGTFANGTDTTTASSGSNGVAVASAFTANTTAGTYAVTAAATGVTPTASLSLDPPRSPMI
jgi:hypothetical protein